MAASDITCTKALAIQVSDAALEHAIISVKDSSSPQQVSQAQLENALTNLQEALNPNEDLLRELDSILRNKPDQVRHTIHCLINKELQRSYINVAGQIRSFKAGLEKFVTLETSEDMRNLRDMLKEMKDSDLRVLEREASNIDSLANDMVRCIQERDFASLQQIARCLEMSSNRFIDNYSKLSVLLQKLAAHCEDLQHFFQQGKETSHCLAKQAEDRCDYWSSMLKGFGLTTGVLSVGLLVASVHTCIVTMMAMHAAAVKAKLVQSAATTASVKAAVAQHAAQAAHPSFWKSLLHGTAAGAAAAGPSFMAASWAHLCGLCAAVGVGAAVAIVVSTKDIVSSKGAYSVASAKASAAAKAATLAQAASASATQTAALTASTGAATMAVCQPMAITSGVIVALFLLGCAGRDKLKTLLGNLWKKEIELHLQTAEAFQALEQHLREVAEQLRSTEATNTKLLEALELVRETAQEMADRAEDAEQVNLPAGPVAERRLERHVEELNTLVDALREQTINLLPVVIEMQTVLDSECPKILPGSLCLQDGNLDLACAPDENLEDLIVPGPSLVAHGDIATSLASSSAVNEGLSVSLILGLPCPESGGAAEMGTTCENEAQSWELVSLGAVLPPSGGSFETEVSEIISDSGAEIEQDQKGSWVCMSSTNGGQDEEHQLDDLPGESGPHLDDPQGESTSLMTLQSLLQASASSSSATDPEVASNISAHPYADGITSTSTNVQ
jgi:hypothetical protein